jgi:paraquat-inducible protein B
MKLKPSPTLIGGFILGAIALGAASVLLFGGRNPMAPKRRIVIYFDESVAGLDQGAAVKLRGVHSGRVLSLVPTLSPDSLTTVVAVICDLSGGELTAAGGRPVDLSDPATLKGLVAQGLRARLKPAGISGESAVDLDFYDPRRYPVRPSPPWLESAQPYPSVPSIPSVTAELLDNLEAFMRQLRKADFAGVARQLSAADYKKTLQQIGDAAASVKDLADYLERNPSSILSGKKVPGKP